VFAAGRSQVDRGELAGIAKKLASHKVNIEYAYSATFARGRPAGR